MSTLHGADSLPGRRALLVLDFDGTMWRGTEPLEGYAEATARGLPAADREAYLARVRAFLAGDRWGAPGPGPVPDDGWSAVAAFAAELGSTPDQRQRAFLATRARIAAGEFRLEVPSGLPAFLAWSRAWCAVTLATNSPPDSVLPVLQRLELTSLFDDIACDARKPAGLTALGQAWMARFGVPASLVMCIGDHYRNDIAPALEAGWLTTYITPWRTVAGPCAVVGTTVEEVLPALRAWVSTIVAGRDGAAEGGPTLEIA